MIKINKNQTKIKRENSEFFTEIINILIKKKLSKDNISKLKVKLCKKHNLRRIPTDIEILSQADKTQISKLKHLQTKPTRTISGVVPLAIMTKPFKCPHGKCAMCPGGVGSSFGDIPQSYTGHEPATMRAIRAGFDPYIQIFNRLEQYILLGHNPEKVELIIMGGTFPATPKKYQEKFVKECFQALNDFGKMFYTKDEINIDKFRDFFEINKEKSDKNRIKSIHSKILTRKNKTKTTNKTKATLIKEQNKNEKAKIRCIGLTIETRPDYGLQKHGVEMLKLGCTRVELGVQSVYDDALKRINRGHTLRDTLKSIRELKDLGFKLNFHYMLGLPGVSKKEDVFGLRELFKHSAFQPDMLKIYPCMVSKGTPLYKEYKKGKFKPIITEEAAAIIVELKKHIPKYCRIMRVQRDIPPKMMEAGVDRSNLRQYVEKLCNEKSVKCRCIRCREVGHKKLRGEKKKTTKKPNIIINIQEYDASHGNEFFISADDEKTDTLYGFCRLRFPSKSLVRNITKNSAIVRELHVFGEAQAIGGSKKDSVQHKGLGKKLLKKAEQIAKKNKKDKIVVISGVGAKEYYSHQGYKKDGNYMSKKL
ncbi:tRNA uridine(34) 5-carboxymethylaminomethyl modification radical SAM/GNAT enzyme Elp3 [Nanoarchaeota archaeon]